MIKQGVMRCDHPGCAKRYALDPVSTRYGHRAKVPSTIRWRAGLAGWLRSDGRDLCPVHAGEAGVEAPDAAP